MKSSITTRLLYLIFLVFVIIVSSLMLAPSIANGLGNLVSYAVRTLNPTLVYMRLVVTRPYNEVLVAETGFDWTPCSRFGFWVHSP